MRDKHKEMVIQVAIQEYRHSVEFGFSNNTEHAISMMNEALIMCGPFNIEGVADLRRIINEAETKYGRQIKMSKLNYSLEEIRSQMGIANGYLDEYFLSNPRETNMIMKEKGCILDLDSIIAIQKALGREITYEDYSTISGSEKFDDIGLFNVTTEHKEELERLLRDGKKNIEIPLWHIVFDWMNGELRITTHTAVESVYTSSSQGEFPVYITSGVLPITKEYVNNYQKGEFNVWCDDIEKVESLEKEILLDAKPFVDNAIENLLKSKAMIAGAIKQKEVRINSKDCRLVQDNNGDKVIEILDFEETKHNIGGVSYSAVKLENGVFLHDEKEFDEWNGECYFVDGKTYYPVYQKVGEDDYEIIGYYER